VRLIQWHWPGWRPFVSAYLAVSLAAHFVWEILQLPLYTIWTTGTRQQLAFAVLHCTIGDVIIAGFSLLIALAVFARSGWPGTGAARVHAAIVAVGLGYTIFSEWLNTSVLGSWTYSDLMPIVPVIGTGLSPLLQWIVVPMLALGFAAGGVPWKKKGAKWPTAL
jgi:hypothetical protein